MFHFLGKALLLTRVQFFACRIELDSGSANRNHATIAEITCDRDESLRRGAAEASTTHRVKLVVWPHAGEICQAVGHSEKRRYASDIPDIFIRKSK